MIDEQLIDEVEQHGVIYNRQKYCINMGAGGGAGIGSGCSSSGVNKYETKDEAWQEIAVNLRSDVETCKKRWKYLRERYVSQRKQGDPPVYEHLSRPYLEKMKFLDQHIQPRKSYRNVSSFLTSPNASNSFCEYNMDSSKSNSSMKNNNHSFNSQQHSQHQQLQQQQSQSNIPYPQENIIKTEEDPTFRDFVAAVASQSQHLQQQINSHHAASFNPNMLVSPGNGSQHGNSNVLSPAIQQQQQSVDSYDQYRSNEPNANAGLPNNVGNGVPSSTSSSMKSPLSSSPPPPPSAVVANNNASSELSDEHNFATNSSGNSMKKARVQMSSKYLDTSDSDDSPASTMRHAKMLSDTKHAAAQHLHQAHQHQQQQQQQQILQQQQKHQQQFNKMFNNAPRNMNSINHTSSAAQAGLFPSSNDFLFSLYQQMSPAAAAAAVQQQERNINAAAASAASPSTARSSEHLLGELVTSELLKMNKDRRKTVQKRILEILFFED
ncbi:polyglutamine-repeat protein pqn-41 isoform X2 [Episyrphus balteatus]|nr:polyglutamine-repeat protein pqn-41 isoform X2 [Episyrphus balteatus]